MPHDNIFRDFLIFWFPFWFSLADRAMRRSRCHEKQIKKLHRKLLAIRAKQAGANAEYQLLMEGDA